MVAKTNILTQEEEEAPAKMYHIQGLKDQLDRMEQGQKEIAVKLEQQASSQVSMKYLEDRLVAISSSFADKITNELSRRDGRMDAFENIVKENKKSMSRFTWATISTGLMIMGSAIAIIYFTSTRA